VRQSSGMAMPVLVFLVWLVIGLACGGGNNKSPAPSANVQTATQPIIEPIVDIPHLIGKTPAEFEKVLGKAIRVTKITNDPDMMPGEYRDYKIEKSIGTLTQDGLWVRFYKGEADHLTFDLPHFTDTPEEALLMAGIDVKARSRRSRHRLPSDGKVISTALVLRMQPR
jgi:hypothetical protein